MSVKRLSYPILLTVLHVVLKRMFNETVLVSTLNMFKLMGKKISTFLCSSNKSLPAQIYF